MYCSMLGFPVHHLLEFAQTRVRWVSDAIQPSQLLLPLLLPSIFPSIRLFSSESALCIRWPKYWSFSFSINPANEYSELISFSIDWLDLLAVQGTVSVFSNTTVQKHQFFGTHPFILSSSHIHTWLLEKPELWLVQMFVGKIMSLLFNTVSRFSRILEFFKEF